jgi:hypothetical protein
MAVAEADLAVDRAQAQALRCAACDPAGCPLPQSQPA